MGLAPALGPLSTIGHRREPQANAFQAVRWGVPDTGAIFITTGSQCSW